MKVPYDSGYVPSAPHLDVRVGAPDESLMEPPLKALVDTGADVTMVPARYIEPLGLQIDNRKTLRSPWGERRLVNVYLLDVGVGDLRLPLIEIVADDRGNEAILGRNVLNRLVMVLDGPKQTLQI